MDDWLLPRLGIHLGAGFISALINATIGAVLLLVIVGLVNGGLRRRWRAGKEKPASAPRLVMHLNGAGSESGEEWLIAKN
jgi:hypothetical protein